MRRAAHDAPPLRVRAAQAESHSAEVAVFSRTRESDQVEMPMTNPSQAATQTKLEELPPMRISRVLHAPRETVFRAWSSAEHVKRWFCPELYTVPEAKGD